MDRIVTFLLLLVAAVLLVPGCIAEEQAATEVVPETVVVEEVAAEEVVANASAEEVVEEIVEEAIAYDVTADMNTTELNMTLNQVVMIELPEDEETGFEYNATLSEGLTLLNETHIGAVEGAEEVGAFHQWFIEAVAAGEQTFSAVEKKADSEETGNEYTLNILVE